MKVWIQNSSNTVKDINNLHALWGFEEKGYEVERFDAEKVEDIDLEDAIVVGGISIVKKALNRLGIIPQDLDYIPEEIKEFAGRKVWFSTLGQAREESPIFIKPRSDNQKLFTGFVSREFRDLIPTAWVPAETPVMCSDVVNFISEYRVFVIEGKIEGIKNYCGDFKVFPDIKIIEKAVEKYKGVAGYGIDFGVTEEGQTLLVEVNGGFSLGCYGLQPRIYATLLEKRWEELVKRG